jgi:hypothetical protein
MAVPLMAMFASQTAAGMLTPIPPNIHIVPSKTGAHIGCDNLMKNIALSLKRTSFKKDLYIFKHPAQVALLLSFISFIYTHKKYLLIMSIQTLDRRT